MDLPFVAVVGALGREFGGACGGVGGVVGRGAEEARMALNTLWLGETRAGGGDVGRGGVGRGKGGDDDRATCIAPFSNELS
jgi:hypothetical protein